METSQLQNAAEEMRDALLNLLGAFDTPMRRLKLSGEFYDEAIESAHEALTKAGVAHGLYER